MDQIEHLRRLQKPELAVSLAALVREVLCPGNEWTLERGRDSARRRALGRQTIAAHQRAQATEQAAPSGRPARVLVSARQRLRQRLAWAWLVAPRRVYYF